MNQPKKIRYWWGILPIAVFLVAWEIAARLNLSPGRLFLPPFSAVMREFYCLIADGVLVENFLSSLVRVLIGFCAGSIAGLAIGILMGWKEIINRTFSPIISLVYPIPALGWLPLLMLWIGNKRDAADCHYLYLFFLPGALQHDYRHQRGQQGTDQHGTDPLGHPSAAYCFGWSCRWLCPIFFTGLQLEAGMAWRGGHRRRDGGDSHGNRRADDAGGESGSG